MDQERMPFDSTPWGAFLVMITVVGLVMICRYTLYTIRHEAENMARSGTELQQVLVVHPDGEQTIAKRL